MEKELKDFLGDMGEGYTVDEIGIVRSYKKNPDGVEMTWRYSKKGYRTVSLSFKGCSKNQRVHRLVAQAFIPNPDNLPQVHHMDEDKDNNTLNNLMWITDEENNRAGTRAERSKKTNEDRHKNMTQEENYKYGVKMVKSRIKSGKSRPIIVTREEYGEIEVMGVFNSPEHARDVLDNGHISDHALEWSDRFKTIGKRRCNGYYVYFAPESANQFFTDNGFI